MHEAFYHITDLHTTGLRQPGPEIKFEKEKFLKFIDKYNADKHTQIQSGKIKNLTKDGNP